MQISSRNSVCIEFEATEMRRLKQPLGNNTFHFKWFVFACFSFLCSVPVGSFVSQWHPIFSAKPNYGNPTHRLSQLLPFYITCSRLSRPLLSIMFVKVAFYWCYEQYLLAILWNYARIVKEVTSFLSFALSVESCKEAIKSLILQIILRATRAHVRKIN